MEKTCKNCGKVLSGRWKNFCSRRCGSLFYIKNNHKETNIEKKMREWLENNHIEFKAQESISNITVPDFVIGKIILFVDGLYWHDRPRRKYTDQRINKRLEKLGYTVIRFNDAEILKDFDSVTEKLNTVITCTNNKL